MATRSFVHFSLATRLPPRYSTHPQRRLRRSSSLGIKSPRTFGYVVAWVLDFKRRSLEPRVHRSTCIVGQAKSVRSWDQLDVRNGSSAAFHQSSDSIPKHKNVSEF